MLCTGPLLHAERTRVASMELTRALAAKDARGIGVSMSAACRISRWHVHRRAESLLRKTEQWRSSASCCATLRTCKAVFTLSR